MPAQLTTISQLTSPLSVVTPATPPPFMAMPVTLTFSRRTAPR